MKLAFHLQTVDSSAFTEGLLVESTPEQHVGATDPTREHEVTTDVTDLAQNQQQVSWQK
jgi:hypothetical protein